jgi:hypothetical protein
MVSLIIFPLIAATSCNGETKSQVDPTIENTINNRSTEIRSKNGETLQSAANRLFKEAYKATTEATEEPEVVKDATVGKPRALSKDYYIPGRILIGWIAYDDIKTAKTGLFKVMKPARLSDHNFIVPMVKDNHAVCEFDLHINREGNWEYGTLIGPLPGGKIYDIEQATTRLKKELGQTSKVRVALLLPSGLVFAVGKNESKESAVYLACINGGDGYKGFHKVLPNTGQLCTADQLVELLTP